MYFYRCYGENWASEKPISPLSSVEITEPETGYWTINYSDPGLQGAAWTALSAGASRDRPKVKISETNLSSQKIYRILRTPNRLGKIDLYIDLVNKQIWYLPNAKLTDNDSASLLVGAIMGNVISIAGGLCLHASAIELDQRGVVFVGPRTAGKSTTAMYLVANCGARLVADDIVVVSQEGQSIVAHPGYGKIRTKSGDMEHMGIIKGENHQPVFEHEHKIYANSAHVSDPVKIDMIVELNRNRDAVDVLLTPYDNMRSFLSCVANVYASETRVSENLLKMEQDILKGLVNKTRVFQAIVPDNLGRLKDLGRQLGQELNV